MGCEITEIAQNQPLILQFNQELDPATVNTSSIQIRTANGEEPVGDYLVNGNRVEYVPQIRVVGGASFFGFRAGETYLMTLPGGPDEINAIRSTSGAPLKDTFSCSLTVSLGIVDLDGHPPRATLVSPSQLLNVPIDSVIRLEFSELLDVTPFVGTGATDGPVTFAVRRTRTATGGTGAEVECNPNAPVAPLFGTPRLTLDSARGISVLSFTPTSGLPQGICVDVLVTDRVRDLAGTPAQPQLFQFITAAGDPVNLENVEEFESEFMLDRDASSGTWAGGVATFGPIGGDGQHGEFIAEEIGTFLGNVGGKDTYLIDTDSTAIPGSQTLSGRTVTVTDGRYFFTKMEVPSNIRLQFTGSNPPVFNVRGKLFVEGIIDVDGGDIGTYNATTETVGQPGAPGGIFGGSGGTGGNRANGAGPNPAYDGTDGEDIQVLRGHAYASRVVGTRGRGSPMFPTHGLNGSLTFPSFFCNEAAAGGAGGGYFGDGGEGVVVVNMATGAPQPSGATIPGGSTFDPFPAPPGVSLIDHLLIGGSGGGGAGSQPLFANSFTPTWAAGGGGTGGGGVVILRAGYNLSLDPQGSITATGGSGVLYSGPDLARVPAPGGAGSGGTLFLQSGATVDVAGLVTVSGGTGSRVSKQPVNRNVQVEGGDGASGYIRLEAPGNPTPALLPQAVPPATAANVAPLQEEDQFSGFQTRFYNTGQSFGPEYLRYELVARVGGVQVTYSDDPAVATLARPGSEPVSVLFQAGEVDLVSGEVAATTLRPWRLFVGPFGTASGGVELGLVDDARNGYRFQVIIDRSFGQSVEIEKLTVFYRY